VEVGFTVTVPEAVEVLKTPGLMAMFVIVPVVVQESVEVPAGATSEGDAEKEEIVGVGFDTVTVIEVDVAVLLYLSVANAYSVCVPFVEEAVFQKTLYGEDVTAEPKGLPSR